MHTLGSHRVYIHGIHKIKSFVSECVTCKITKTFLKLFHQNCVEINTCEIFTSFIHYIIQLSCLFRSLGLSFFQFRSYYFSYVVVIIIIIIIIIITDTLKP